MITKEIVKFGGMEVHFGLGPEDSNNQMSMFKCVIHAGVRMPVPHYHEHFDEAVYGLKGTVTYTVAGEKIEIAAGDCCFIPRGVVHGFENKTNDTIEFLAICTPGLFQLSYFQEIATIVNAGGPPDVAKIKEVMGKHGLVPVMG